MKSTCRGLEACLHYFQRASHYRTNRTGHPKQEKNSSIVKFKVHGRTIVTQNEILPSTYYSFVFDAIEYNLHADVGL